MTHDSRMRIALGIVAQWKAYSLTALNVRGTSRLHRHLECPTLKREADVEILVREGQTNGVAHCSLLGNFDIVTCREGCLATAKRTT
ncbi:MAG: hypothetical protein OEV08_14850 [Nitrospira sp.]|nr:hypothetical protein [Nitrospira sp.]